MASKDRLPNIAIIGGGVTGLTTAIMFKLCGYPTKLCTHKLVEDYDEVPVGKRPSKFASIQAAASVLPHSVELGPIDMDQVLKVSWDFFHRLAFRGAFGVRTQRHYEVFEKHVTPPEFARYDRSFVELDRGDWYKNLRIPKRKRAQEVFGWYFDCFFCEVPTYMRQLLRLFENTLAGLVVRGHKYRDFEHFIQENPESDVIINCTGAWSRDLVPSDRSNTEFIRGHMVKVAVYDVPRDKEGKYFSYNYSPSPEVYPDPDRGQADVYFYPRSDGWLLGGSRQFGDIPLDEEGNANWTPKKGLNYEVVPNPIEGRDAIKVPMIQRPGWAYQIPEPIWNLNRELIKDVAGVDINRFKSQSYIGYRFQRKPVRVEMGTELSNVKGGSEKKLFHNYGHGGAGYTLSWGCANEILHLVEKELSVTPNFQKYRQLDAMDEGGMLAFILQEVARKYYQERLEQRSLVVELPTDV